MLLCTYTDLYILTSLFLINLTPFYGVIGANVFANLPLYSDPQQKVEGFSILAHVPFSRS